MGLRSFAKQYPASVASGSLRELIAILRRDGLGEAGSTKSADGQTRKGDVGAGDVDTIRLVLETLLMLFNPDSSSPEASDEIALFMADEFSMRQDNITLLLSLLDPTSPYADYYSRLYTVQLLSAVCAARPERLQECIMSAPLGISRLVGVLDDGRDAVRNAGLLLLVDLTTGANEDLRKIVAFEDVFARTFVLIRAEGGLAEAGITAQDCLSLLANLIKNSASNQTMFRESGCVIHMAQLLWQAFPPSPPEAPFIAQGREKATWGLLQLLDLFLMPGEAGTPHNQNTFFRAGTAQVLIDLGFCVELPSPIRTSALRCAAALIVSNSPLQEAFAGLTVVTPADARMESKPGAQLNGTRSGPPSARNSARPSLEKPRTYIIEALLDLSLIQPQHDRTLRRAACTLIQAYLSGHDRIKAHFMERAVAGCAQHETAGNALITLLQPGGDASAVTFAAWIVSDLIADEPRAKVALANVKEGDENAGEDVLTAVQAIGSQLHLAVQSADERLVAAYGGLLAVFTWDFADGVDALLDAGSSLLQALVTAASPQLGSAVTAGLAAVLLGTIYEFSTKDSPVPRRTLAPLMTQKLGRSKYLESLAELRRHPAIRDFDLGEVEGEEMTALSRTFVDLFTVEYSRLRRAIDKDPGVEVLPLSAAEAGVDRDVLDDLRQQLQTTKDALAHAQQEALVSDQQYDQDRMSAAKELQTANAEVERLRRINQAVQQGHESELEKLAAQHDQRKQEMVAELQRATAVARQEAERQAQVALWERESSSSQKAQEYERRIAELGNAHRAEQSGHASTVQKLEALTARLSDVSAREKSFSLQLDDLTQRHQRLQQEHRQLQASAPQAEAEFERLRKQLDDRQQQLERFNIQISELKDELKGKDEELATERAGFAELEKELEAAKAALGGSAADAHTVEELQQARETGKSAREELENMLLVMSDIEAKRDQYKAKIKDLGGEVTDEDGDEEGEGEEEEEEEEEDVD